MHRVQQPTALRTILKEKLYHIIFESDTPSGKAFDVALLIAIGLSILTVTLESVSWIVDDYGRWIKASEWFFTVLFTIEYLIRIYCAPHRGRYVRSFYGLIDFVSILPTYLSLLIAGTQYAQCNFASVGDENLVKQHGISC